MNSGSDEISALPLDELSITPQWLKSTDKSYDRYTGHEGADSDRPRGHHDRNRDRDRGGPRPPQTGKPGGGGAGKFGHRPGGRPSGPGGRPSGPGGRPSGPGDRRMDQRSDHRRPPMGKPGPHGKGPQRPPEHRPAPAAVEVSFIPEEKRFAVMLDTLKQSTRAYAFFDIARLILNKPERHIVKLAAKPAADGKRAPMWLVSPGESPFLTRDEAIRFLLRRHTSLLWKQIETPIDPPKGNFTFVNRCGFTGELFGPPNYHEYQTRIIRHWKEHFSREMSFDRFKARIETSKTPEAVKMWLEQMSSKAEFECRCCSPAPSKEAATAPPPSAPAADAPVEPVQDVSEAAISAEPEQPTPETPPEPMTPDEPDGGMEVTSESPEQITPETPPEPPEPETALEPEPAPEPEAESMPEPASAPRFATREEVEKHILANHLDKFITSAAELQISGPASRRIAHDGIHEAVREAWETECGFPLKTATSFQMRLRQDGFNFFKDRKGITYISRIRLKRFEAGQVLTESIQKIVSFLREHDGATRKKLLATLAPPAKTAAAPVAAPAESNAVAPAPEATASAAPETTPAPAAAAPVPGPAPAAITVPSPEEEQVLRDLHWLIADGFVVELFNGKLWMPLEKRTPPPPAPVVQPVPASASTEAVPAVPAEAPATTDEVSAAPAVDGDTTVPPQETAVSPADVIPPESSSQAPTTESSPASS